MNFLMLREIQKLKATVIQGDAHGEGKHHGSQEQAIAVGDYPRSFWGIPWRTVSTLFGAHSTAKSI